MFKAMIASVFGLAALLPLAASADGMPSYATRPPESVTGTIGAVTGKYTLTVNDSRGFVDSVTLRDGTVISPTGISLQPGQSVTISGKANGNTFDAFEIDVDPSSVATTYNDQAPAYYNDGAYPYGGDPYAYYGSAYGGYSPYGYGIYGYSPYYYGYGGFGGYYGGYGYCCSSSGPSKYTGPGQRYGPAPPHNYAPPATGSTGTSTNTGRGLQPISRGPVFGGRTAPAPTYHAPAPSAHVSAPAASRGGGGRR